MPHNTDGTNDSGQTPRDRRTLVEKLLEELRAKLNKTQEDIEAYDREKKMLDQSLAQSDSAVEVAAAKRYKLEERRNELAVFVSEQFEALGGGQSPLSEFVAGEKRRLDSEIVKLAGKCGFGEDISAGDIRNELKSKELADVIWPVKRYRAIEGALRADAAARSSLRTLGETQNFLVTFATSVGSELDRLSKQQAAITVALTEGRRAYSWYLLKKQFSIGVVDWSIDSPLPMPKELRTQLDTQLAHTILAEQSADDAKKSVLAADEVFAKNWDRLIELVFDGERVLAEQLKSEIETQVVSTSPAPGSVVTAPTETVAPTATSPTTATSASQTNEENGDG